MAVLTDEAARLIGRLPDEDSEWLELVLRHRTEQRSVPTTAVLSREDRVPPMDSGTAVPELSADLQELTLRLREVERFNPEAERVISAMQALMAELANRRQFTDWQDVEAAHKRGEITDPLLLALLNAPEDDEPETDEERAAVEEAREAIRRGETRSWEEVRLELDAEAAHG